MKSLRILMLEDNVLDVAVIQKILTRAPFKIEFTVVSSGKDYTEKLNDVGYDAILCDYQLPDFDATQALKLRNQKSRTTPFILITGALSEKQAIAILKEGANDYILKDRLQRLPVALEKAISKQQLTSDKESLEASLSELTERFQFAAQTSFDVIWEYNLEKNLLYCSKAIEKITGAEVDEKLDPSFLRAFIHQDDLGSIEKSFFRIIKSSEHRWRKIFRLVRNDGAVAWVNVNAVILRNKEDRAVRMVGVLRDITEVRKLQQELVSWELNSQKQISKAILEAQEKERMEIGKELHDNVNQLLATAKIMLDTARNNPDLREVCLLKSQESIMEAINELRNLAHSMMPPPFDDNDFEHILNDLLFKIRLTGKLTVNLSLPASKKLRLIDNQIKLTTYRIIQEQISNILKHAHARNLFISIRAKDHDLELIIRDDGVGFDTQKSSGGIGLRNIKNRCSLFGGAMSLTSSFGKGCELRVNIPIRNPALPDKSLVLNYHQFSQDLTG